MALGGEDALKVFVGGLPKGCSQDSLTAWGSQFGSVTRVEIKVDQMGQPRGFGFIYYEDASQAQALIANKDNNMMDGKWIDCKPVMPSSSAMANKGLGKGSTMNDPTNPKLFVGGLPRAATQETLTAHFAQFGSVKEVEVRLHQDGSCKGFSFVTFDDPSSAKAVLDNHANNTFEGKWIDCKSAVANPGGGGGFGGGFGKGKGKGMDMSWGGKGGGGGYGGKGMDMSWGGGGYGGGYAGGGGGGCGGYGAYGGGCGGGGYGMNGGGCGGGCGGGYGGCKGGAGGKGYGGCAGGGCGGFGGGQFGGCKGGFGGYGAMGGKSGPYPGPY